MKTLVVMVFAFCMSACALDPTKDQTEQAPDDPQAVSTDEPAKVAGPVTPMFAACGTSGPDLQKQVIADAAFSSGGATQRSGSSTTCTAIGVLQPTDDAEYFCWTDGHDTFTWTYLRNVRTGVRGWVRDDLLKNFGSNKFCGF